MNITASRLTAAAGLCAAAAGAIFIGVQINHPPADVAHVVTTEMAGPRDREGPDGRPGAGRLHRHVPPPPPPVRRPRAGRLPRCSASATSRMFAVQCIVGFVLPTVAALEPGLRPGRPRRGRRAAARAATSAHMQRAVHRLRHRLLARRSAVRHRAVPRRRPGPLGVRAARRRHHLRARARRAAGVLQPPVRRPHRHRADRPRRLAVARPAPAVRDRRLAGGGVGRGAGRISPGAGRS